MGGNISSGMEIMESGDADPSSLDPEVLEEVEAVSVIFDGQVTSNTGDDGVDIVFVDQDLAVTFSLGGKYPAQGPSVQVSHSCPTEILHLTNALEKCIRNNLDSPMLYNLISRTLEVRPPVVKEPDPSTEVQRVQCVYYMKGNCKFGVKCFNLHSDGKGDKECGNGHVATDDELIDENTNECVSNLDKVAVTPASIATTIGEKMNPMKTATDVINRILWDESFPTELFVVGYLDRFTGIQEKPFKDFSWEDIAAVDDTEVLAIPKHRIQYFKFHTAVVWDKTKRLDRVFGSTGDVADILDIIRDESVLVSLSRANVDE